MIIYDEKQDTKLIKHINYLLQFNTSKLATEISLEQKGWEIATDWKFDTLYERQQLIDRLNSLT